MVRFPSPANVAISDRYQRPLLMAMVISTIIAILSALTLDGGETARLTGIGLLVYWAWVVVAVWRRPDNPTSIDLLLIRWGFLPLIIGFQVAIRYVWHWRGLY